MDAIGKLLADVALRRRRLTEAQLTGRDLAVEFGEPDECGKWTKIVKRVGVHEARAIASAVRACCPRSKAGLFIYLAKRKWKN